MSKQGFCPVCNEPLTGHYQLQPEFQDGELFFNWECSCGAIGEEHYIMTFDDHYNITDVDGECIEEYYDDKQ